MASGGKHRAEQFRTAYYARRKLQGERLYYGESDYFTDETGRRVGVTWSAQGEDGKWFLNLMKGKFEEAVLLCQIRSDTSVAVRLPTEFMNRYWHSFSIDKNDEMKFHIGKERGIWNITLLKPIGPVEISEFVEKEPVVVQETDAVYFSAGTTYA